MAQLLDDLDPRQALAEIAHEFHARGWMRGTAGNLSVRADDEHFWITASGRPKGRLDRRDFLLARVQDGTVVEKADPANQPSAETAIHAALYRLFADARAVLHGHSVEAVAAARAKKGAKGLRLPAIEMIKGFDIWQQNPKVELPLFDNHIDVARIARDIEARFRRVRPPLTALLIRDHGATVWGRGLQEAYNRFECLEFLFAVLARR
jgi:methylthioribulose-1-phosphate dehydratase